MGLFVILMVIITPFLNLKKSRIKLVNKLYDEGHTIIIDTARGSVSGKNYFFFTVNQLKSWGKISYR